MKTPYSFTDQRISTLISPADVRDYAKVRGWIPVPEAISDRLFVLNNPSAKYSQIVVPMDVDRPDYEDAVRIAIGNLAEREERPFSAVEASLKEAGADTLRLGVTTMQPFEEGLPLSYAAGGIAGAEKALRAAACSEMKRQPFHPKMKRTEAQKLVDAAQMCHTEVGSFVLKIACPIDAIEDETPLLPRHPFVRRAILGLSEAVQSLIGALEADNLSQLVEEAQKEGKSPLSANLCEALLAFQDQKRKANVDFSVSWSARLESPAPNYYAKTRIQWDYFPRIEEVRRALQPVHAPLEQSFIGTVDELKGDFGPDEPMKGEVVLDLLVDGESIKAKASLSADHHKLAHQAYASPKPYVKFRGILSHGNQPRKLIEVKDFVILGR